MIEFRKSLNLAASQLENHLDYALEEFGQKCVRQGPVPLVPNLHHSTINYYPSLWVCRAVPGNDDFAIAASRSATRCCVRQGPVPWFKKF